MSDYLRVALGATYSENSDYSDPDWTTKSWDLYEVTPDEARVLNKFEAPSGGSTLGITDFASVTFAAVQNMSTTIDVTVVWTDTDASANSQRIPPGGLWAVSDLDPSAAFTLTSDSSTALCRVIIAGS